MCEAPLVLRPADYGFRSVSYSARVSTNVETRWMGHGELWRKVEEEVRSLVRAVEWEEGSYSEKEAGKQRQSGDYYCCSCCSEEVSV